MASSHARPKFVDPNEAATSQASNKKGPSLNDTRVVADPARAQDLSLFILRAQVAVPSDGIAIALRDGDTYVCRASSGSAPECGVTVAPNHGVCGQCLATGQVTMHQDLPGEVKSVLAIPVIRNARVEGFLAVFARRPHAFGSVELAKLSEFVDSIELGTNETPAATSAAFSGFEFDTITDTPLEPNSAAPLENGEEPLPSWIAEFMDSVAVAPTTEVEISASEVDSPEYQTVINDVPEPVKAPEKTKEPRTREDRFAALHAELTAAHAAEQNAARDAQLRARSERARNTLPVFTALPDRVPWLSKRTLVEAAIVLAILLLGILALRMYLNRAPTASTTTPAPQADTASLPPVVDTHEVSSEPSGSTSSREKRKATRARESSTPKEEPIEVDGTTAIPTQAVSVPDAPTLPLAPAVSSGKVQIANTKTSLPVLATPAPGVTRPAKLVSKTDPVYPPAARSARIKGTVALVVTVNPDGTVASARPVDGPIILSDAAAKAIRAWRYDPALDNGRPVPYTIGVKVIFK